MTPAEIDQCRREWEEASKQEIAWASLKVYDRWFYPLLLHARTIEAERAGAQPLPNQYARQETDLAGVDDDRR